MADASRKTFGAGRQDQGKGDASGGPAPEAAERLTANAVLSDRDGTRHLQPRGLDSPKIRIRHGQDSARNRLDTAEATDLPDRGTAASRGTP